MVFVTWKELASLVERASTMRSMTVHERAYYKAVAAELREPPLAGRRCKGCGGPILQRPVDDECGDAGEWVTFKYDCTCSGSEPLDKSLPWVDVPEKEAGVWIIGTSFTEGFPLMGVT